MQDHPYEGIPFLSKVGLMLTYQCKLACPHCLVKSTNDGIEEMSLTLAHQWLDQLSAFKKGFTSNISLSGGESFCNLPYLLNIATYAYQLGFVVSVNTNAIWATSKEEALRVLQLCFSIQTITVHTNVQQQKQIPFEHVKNAIWAANKLEKSYQIEIDTDNKDSREYHQLMNHILQIASAEQVNVNYILPMEMMFHQFQNNNNKHSLPPPQAACAKACFPIIYPDGNVIACKGAPTHLPDFHPLFLGNLNRNTLYHIFEKAESNFMLHAIRNWGPKGLVQLIKDSGYSQILPNYYQEDANCNICYKLFANNIICEALKDLIEKEEGMGGQLNWGMDNLKME